MIVNSGPIMNSGMPVGGAIAGLLGSHSSC